MKEFFSQIPEGHSIKVFVQPRSSQNKIVGSYGDALKIKLTAPPVDGAANKMCIDFLAKLFKLPKTAIEIISGHSSRTKQVRVLVRNDQKRSQLIHYLKSF
jgi:uncharacterized protein (TIGR00251 family)